MFYDIVKTGFIIEFNDTAEIVRYNTTTAVRRAMCCAVASARDIGRRRDQGPGRGCRAHTSGPRLPAPSSSVPVIGKITSQCLSLNSAVTSWGRHTAKSSSFIRVYLVLRSTFSSWKFSVRKNGLRSREQNPNKWWYRIYRQEYRLVKGSSGGIQMRLCRDRDLYKEIISAESLSELP